MARGMYSRILNTPTIPNISETRDKGRLQWLLVMRKAAAASGPVLVTMNTNENMAA